MLNGKINTCNDDDELEYIDPFPIRSKACALPTSTNLIVATKAPTDPPTGGSSKSLIAAMKHKEEAEAWKKMKDTAKAEREAEKEMKEMTKGRKKMVKEAKQGKRGYKGIAQPAARGVEAEDRWQDRTENDEGEGQGNISTQALLSSWSVEGPNGNWSMQSLPIKQEGTETCYGWFQSHTCLKWVCIFSIYHDADFRQNKPLLL